mmetsp:Transcript_64353/g.176635  ORF Transcript_64353/g.176635 Transcript_64353/m.176635 type:complete len:326 (+) Transcript_64353:65-1042(+)
MFALGFVQAMMAPRAAPGAAARHRRACMSGVQDWLDSQMGMLPVLASDRDAALLLPGQSGWISMSPERQPVFDSARLLHHSCLGQPIGDDGLIAVLEVEEQQDADESGGRRVRVKCVGRALAELYASDSVSTPVKPFRDRELELYDIFAAADYEAVILQADANCCAILSRIAEHRQARGHDGGAADDVPAELVAEPLPFILAKHRAALSADAPPELRGAGAHEPWKTTIHPGLAIVQGGAMACDRPASYSGTAAPDDTLTRLGALWGRDHDAAETQFRSFGTASCLPPLQALQTRDTLERLELSVVAFTLRERQLAARLALEQAL